MKIAIMQPYFFPYIGYFQLINAVDKFVIYDNIEFTKKGWINRNRILMNGKDELITLPLKKDSDYLHVDKRHLSDNWTKDKVKLLNKIKSCYLKAPNYKETMPFIELCLEYKDSNLFQFIFNSIQESCAHLSIQTELIKSSNLDINHELKSSEKVKAICNNLNADTYINPIGGVDLYSKEDFMNEGIQLNFIQSKLTEYKQFDAPFLPWLSLIDVLMFNSKEQVKDYLTNNFTLN